MAVGTIGLKIIKRTKCHHLMRLTAQVNKRRWRLKKTRRHLWPLLAAGTKLEASRRYAAPSYNQNSLQAAGGPRWRAWGHNSHRLIRINPESKSKSPSAAYARKLGPNALFFAFFLVKSMQPLVQISWTDAYIIYDSVPLYVWYLRTR